jgi:hypothetical protein
MDKSTLADMERPSSPAEAALFHEIEQLKLQVQSIFTAMVEYKQRLTRLESKQRPGDD